MLCKVRRCQITQLNVRTHIDTMLDISQSFRNLTFAYTVCNDDLFCFDVDFGKAICFTRYAIQFDHCSISVDLDADCFFLLLFNLPTKRKFIQFIVFRCLFLCQQVHVVAKQPANLVCARSLRILDGR